MPNIAGDIGISLWHKQVAKATKIINKRRTKNQRNLSRPNKRVLRLRQLNKSKKIELSLHKPNFGMP